MGNRSKKVSTSEYKFVVDPTEDDDARWSRWDQQLQELHAGGLTVAGVGPDGDWPIRNEPAEGQTWADFWADPTGKFTEVYSLVPLTGAASLSDAEVEAIDERASA